jgi:hypothetical protein
MHRPLLLVATFCVVLSSFSMPDAAAQTGWVHLHTHLAADLPNYDEGVSRTFEQSGNSTVETFTLAYGVGAHTLALVETRIGVCRATASNISFTIVANQWSEVDVPVTLQDCSFPIGTATSWEKPFAGTGTISLQSGSTSVHEYGLCTTARNPGNGNRVFYTNFHACQATIPVGTTFHTTVSPGGGSCCVTVQNGTQLVDGSVQSPTVTIATNDTIYHGDSSFSTDVAIRRVRSSIGGQVMSSTFEVVNHGPNLADPLVHFDSLVAKHYGDEGYPATVMFSTSDGICIRQNGNDNGCYIGYLPVGDTATVTVRIDGTPDKYSATTSTPTCGMMIVTNYKSQNDLSNGRPDDPDHSNNAVACSDDAVPVVVALGGSTPSSHTVSVGSLNVPMIEFTLNPTAAQTINSVTIAASGSGNEQVDVTSVKLYVDKNSNGQVDVGDSAIASSTFAANDGTVIMTVSPAYSISAPTSLLVTYDFNLTVAQRLGGGLTLAMLPLLLIPAVWRRKRVTAMVVMAMLSTMALTACGSDSSTGPPAGGGSVTFQSSLTNVNISGTDVASALNGATITIKK